MPESVDFRRLVQNILNALEIKKDIEKEITGTEQPNDRSKLRRKTNKYDKWKNYLEVEENKAIVSDAFWYYICKYKRRRVNYNLDSEGEECYLFYFIFIVRTKKERT
jgi:hypothetical protein